jgi:hypothetical protein
MMVLSLRLSRLTRVTRSNEHSIVGADGSTVSLNNAFIACNVELDSDNPRTGCRARCR